MPTLFQAIMYIERVAFFIRTIIFPHDKAQSPQSDETTHFKAGRLHIASDHDMPICLSNTNSENAFPDKHCINYIAQWHKCFKNSMTKIIAIYLQIIVISQLHSHYDIIAITCHPVTCHYHARAGFGKKIANLLKWAFHAAWKVHVLWTHQKRKQCMA